MKINRLFYKCDLCGNQVYVVENSEVKMSCCNQEMTLLTPNTVDASLEKHVPIATIDKGKLLVTVGSVIHPMTTEHHISWIAVAQGSKLQLINLEKTDEPTAVFNVEEGNIEEGNIEIYEYCNLHGLWKTELNDFSHEETVCSHEFSKGCI